MGVSLRVGLSAVSFFRASKKDVASIPNAWLPNYLIVMSKNEV